jgi:hypothetical protein
MTVWLCQCLCPARHAILASAGEAESELDAVDTIRDPLREKLAEIIGAGLFNPWCALCGAHRDTWRFELSRTRFATMEEAMPVLRQAEAVNIAMNPTIGDLHKTRPN